MRSVEVENRIKAFNPWILDPEQAGDLIFLKCRALSRRPFDGLAKTRLLATLKPLESLEANLEVSAFYDSIIIRAGENQ